MSKEKTAIIKFPYLVAPLQPENLSKQSTYTTFCPTPIYTKRVCDGEEQLWLKNDDFVDLLNHQPKTNIKKQRYYTKRKTQYLLKKDTVGSARQSLTVCV